MKQTKRKIRANKKHNKTQRQRGGFGWDFFNNRNNVPTNDNIPIKVQQQESSSIFDKLVGLFSNNDQPTESQPTSGGKKTRRRRYKNKRK